jgi:PAS domain S-box-containing protein
MASHPRDEAQIRDCVHSEIHESPDWFRDLVEHSQDLLCIHDLEGRLLSVNPVPARLLGYSVEEILQKPLRELLSPKYRDYFDAYLEEIRRNSEASGLMAVITRTGETRIWEFHNTLRREGLSSPVVRGIAHDVTDRVRAEKRLRAINEALIRTTSEQEAALQRLRLSDNALRASEARERARAKELETVLDAVPVPVYISRDRGCRRIIGNRAACEQLRVAPGQNFSKSAPADELPTFRVLQDGLEVPADLLPMQQAAKTGEPIYERSQTMVFEDGTRRETLMNAAPLLDEHGEIHGAVGAEVDLTAWKEVLRALRESELRFRAVYERSPVGICLVDSRSGRFLQVNAKCCEIAGRSEEELLRTNVAKLTHPDDLERGTEYLRQLVAEELTNYEMEKRYVRPDGTVRWVRVLVVPMWEKGETNRWHMALIEDVTDRKQTEEALRQSEERFRVALKNSPIAVFTQDRDLRYTWMYNSQLPWSGKDKLGKTPAEIFTPEEAERIAEVRRRVLETGNGTRCETQITHEGKKFYLDTTIEPLLNSTGAVVGLTGASMDVSELREKSEALREAKRKLTEEKLYLEKKSTRSWGSAKSLDRARLFRRSWSR